MAAQMSDLDTLATNEELKQPPKDLPSLNLPSPLSNSTSFTSDSPKLTEIERTASKPPSKRQSGLKGKGIRNVSASCTECRRRKQKCNQAKDKPCNNCARRYPPVLCIYECTCTDTDESQCLTHTQPYDRCSNLQNIGNAGPYVLSRSSLQHSSYGHHPASASILQHSNNNSYHTSSASILQNSSNDNYYTSPPSIAMGTAGYYSKANDQLSWLSLSAPTVQESPLLTKMSTLQQSQPPKIRSRLHLDHSDSYASFPHKSELEIQGDLGTTVNFRHTQKSPSRSHTDSPSRSDTISSATDDDADWSEVDIRNSPQSPNANGRTEAKQFDQRIIKERFVASRLTPFKKKLVDRIMEEFWLIFDQENQTIKAINSVGRSVKITSGPIFMTTGGVGQSCSPSTKGYYEESTDSSNKFTGASGGKYKRDNPEEQDENNGDQRAPKRPRTLFSPPQSQDDNAKFACPYRKRDPRKYCVKHWRSCALTPLETVARVKGHLYHYHRIFPCQRCKVLFKDADAVNVHLKEPNGCELLNIVPEDGITPELHEKLRSKKKAQRDQTEADRWKDIYKLLFPNEMIPSPYFKAIEEDLMSSPDSRELSDYEEYCRRELPRDFRAALEEVIHNESQPMEERIRNQLMDIIRDCQERVFLRYRSMAETTPDTPSIPPASSDASTIGCSPPQHTVLNAPAMSFRPATPPFFQPSTPESRLNSSFEDSATPNQIWKASENIQLSETFEGSWSQLNIGFGELDSFLEFP